MDPPCENDICARTTARCRNSSVSPRARAAADLRARRDPPDLPGRLDLQRRVRRAPRARQGPLGPLERRDPPDRRRLDRRALLGRQDRLEPLEPPERPALRVRPGQLAQQDPQVPLDRLDRPVLRARRVLPEQLALPGQLARRDPLAPRARPARPVRQEPKARQVRPDRRVPLELWAPPDRSGQQVLPAPWARQVPRVRLGPPDQPARPASPTSQLGSRSIVLSLQRHPAASTAAPTSRSCTCAHLEARDGCSSPVSTCPPERVLPATRWSATPRARSRP